MKAVVNRFIPPSSVDGPKAHPPDSVTDSCEGGAFLANPLTPSWRDVVLDARRRPPDLPRDEMRASSLHARPDEPGGHAALGAAVDLERDLPVGLDVERVGRAQGPERKREAIRTPHRLPVVDDDLG